MFNFKNKENKEMEENTELEEQETTETQEAQEEIQEEEVSEVQNLKDQYLRLNADFQNYKTRTAKEQAHWAVTLQAGVFEELLAVVDNFDRALAQSKKDMHEDMSAWITGYELIHKELTDLLQKHGVQEITDNKMFNPELHEALMQVESEEHESGAVVQVLEKGYMFKTKVLRPAKVSVAK